MQELDQEVEADSADSYGAEEDAESYGEDEEAEGYGEDEGAESFGEDEDAESYGMDEDGDYNTEDVKEESKLLTSAMDKYHAAMSRYNDAVKAVKSKIHS